MSEMIERVAKAIDDALVQRVGYPEHPSHSDILDAARAAIEAMREPTEAMVAADAEWDEGADYCRKNRYRAMIDAALSKPVGGG